MDIRQIKKEFDQAIELSQTMTEQWITLRNELDGLDENDVKRASLTAEAYVLYAEHTRLVAKVSELNDQIQDYYSHYRRPSGKIFGLSSRILGPLPKDTERITLEYGDLRELPRYRFLPLATMVVVIATMLTILALVPLARISPLTVFFARSASTGEPTQPSTPGVVIGIIAIVVLALTVAKRRKFILGAHLAALEDEQWFRSGAENWTPWQRLRSCAVSGTRHVINITFPLATLPALSLASAVFMSVYLAEFRRSHDVKRATLAAARFHAVYSMYSYVFIAACLIAWAFSPLVT